MVCNWSAELFTEHKRFLWTQPHLVFLPLEGRWPVNVNKEGLRLLDRNTHTHTHTHNVHNVLNQYARTWSHTRLTGEGENEEKQKQQTISGRAEELLLQWFMESITKHEPVYSKYTHRLHFVCNPSITSKLPLFNFMFQLSDDSNFIPYLKPLCLATLCHCFFPPLSFFSLTASLATAVTKDNQRVKRKLWDGEECYCETHSGQVMVPFKLQLLDLFSGCPQRLNVQYSMCGGEVSWTPV